MAPKKAKAASKGSKATKTSKAAKGSKATKTTKASKVSKTSKASKTPKATQASTATQSLGEPEEPERLGRYQRKRAMSVEFTIPHKKGKLEVESPIEEVDMQDVVADMKAFEADLDHSYVDELAEIRAEHEREFPPPIKPERATWTYNGPLPLNDTSKLPEGWTWDEPDLDKLDIDAQIERCHERIAEQILPFYFEHRLKEYQAAKDIQDEMGSSERGNYSLDVLKRISSLKIIEKDLGARKDEYKQLVNVKALLRAYRSHQLDWNNGLVTYWSRGEQLCQPRPLHWAEFEALNRKHEGSESFWVEGMGSPGPTHLDAAITIQGDDWDLYFYPAGVRLTNARGSAVLQPTPGKVAGYISAKNTPLNAAGDLPIPATGLASVPWWVSLDFEFDTGAGIMTIWQSDVDLLRGAFPLNQVFVPMTTGCTTVTVGDGSQHTFDCILVQVCLLDPASADPSGTRLTPWTYSVAAIKAGQYPAGGRRLDGPWLRNMLYQATQPINGVPLTLSNNKNGLNLTAGHVPAQPTALYAGTWPAGRSYIARLGPDPPGPGVAKVPPNPADRWSR